MLAYGEEVFDCSAMVEHEPRMANLRRASEKITFWLVMEGIPLDGFYATIETDATGFEFGFRINNAYLDDFAEIEKSFWIYVNELVPLKVKLLTWIYSPAFEPLCNISNGPDDFLLLIDPDLESGAYKFPPQEFWTARNDAFKRESAIEWARMEDKRRNRPIKLVASEGRRVD